MNLQIRIALVIYEHLITLSSEMQLFWKKEISEIEKVGKRKNWIGGRDGVGHKLVVELQQPGKWAHEQH